jgi:uncharacterized protein (TIGR02246 family)
MKMTILILLTFGLLINVQAQNQDDIAIKKLVTNFEKIFNQKDAKGTASFWSEDGDFVTYLGDLLHGRQEIEKYFQTTFTRYYQTAQTKLSEPMVRFLKPDISAVDVKWEIIGRKDADGKSLPTLKGIMVWTMTKEKEQWFIEIMHNVTLPD